MYGPLQLAIPAALVVFPQVSIRHIRKSACSANALDFYSTTDTIFSINKMNVFVFSDIFDLWGKGPLVPVAVQKSRGGTWGRGLIPETPGNPPRTSDPQQSLGGEMSQTTTMNLGTSKNQMDYYEAK